VKRPGDARKATGLPRPSRLAKRGTRLAVEIVADVVFARPDDLHGRAGITRDERGFHGVVLDEAAAKSPADERDMHFDVLAGNAEGARYRLRRGSGNLRGRPEFAGIAAHVGRAIDRLHCGVGEKRHVIDGFDFLCSRLMSLAEVTVAANNGARFGGQAKHCFAKASGGF